MFNSFSSSEKIIEKSRKLLEKGRIEKAVQVFEGPLRKTPNHMDLLLGLAEVYCIIKEPQAALREYRKAFKSNADKAREILKVLDHPPGDIKREDFFDLRFEILIHLRELESAFKILGKTAEPVLMRVLERNGARIAELRKISEGGQNGMLIAELGYTMALILEYQQKHSQSFSVYSSIITIRAEELVHLQPRLEKMLEQVRDDAQPFLFVGDLLRKSKPKKAAACYDRALDIDSKTGPQMIERFRGSAKGAEAFWVLGRAYLINGEWENGVNAFHKIDNKVFQPRMIELLKRVDPSREDVEPALLYLGDLFLDSGSLEEASKTYEVLSGRIDAERLRKRFGKILERDPENMNAARMFGKICMDQGDLDGSLEQMRKVAQSDPLQADALFERAFPLLEDHFEDPELPLFLAELCLGHERAERPLVLLRRFVQLAPERAGEALPFCRELIQKHPSLSSAKITEAEALTALGQHREALQSLRNALAMEPSMLQEVLPHLSRLVRKEPALGAGILGMAAELERQGGAEPALDLVGAESAMASGAYGDAVDRMIRCALNATEQRPVIDRTIEEWASIHPDRIELTLGLAKYYFRTERFEDVSRVLHSVICDYPESTGQVVSFYREVLKERPEEMALHRGLLDAYFKGGTYDLVLSEGKKLEKIVQAPKIAPIHSIMGDACREMGRFTEAVSLYYQSFREDKAEAESVAGKLEQVLQVNPSLSKASLALGTVLAACDKVEEGVECLLRLMRDLPGSRDTVMKYLSHISSTHPMHLAPILGMAELHVLAGRYDTALEFLWKAIHRDTKDADAILRLLDQIAEKNPKMDRVHMEMGKVYLKVGLYAKAADHIVRSVEGDLALSEQGIKFCHDIITSKPDEISAHVAISRILILMKRHAAALSFLCSSGDAHPEIREALLPRMEEAAGMVPETPETLKSLAWAYFKTDRIDPSVRAMSQAFSLDPSYAKEGANLFSVVIQEHPHHAQARFVRGRCRLNMLDLKGAFEDIRTAVQRDAGKVDEGIDLLQDILEKGYVAVELYMFLGQLYLRHEDYERGIDVLKKGLQNVTEKDDKLCLLIPLAEYYEKTGNLAAARNHLDQARELSQDQGFYYQKLNEFAVDRIHFDVRHLEQEADCGQALSMDQLKRLISYLVLMDREDDAAGRLQDVVQSLPPEEALQAWAHFHEETGNYSLALQYREDGDLHHRIHLLEQAGEKMMAASLLEEAIQSDPDHLLNNHLKKTYASLMEESLLQEKFPLMGQTRLKITAS